MQKKEFLKSVIRLRIAVHATWFKLNIIFRIQYKLITKIVIALIPYLR